MYPANCPYSAYSETKASLNAGMPLSHSHEAGHTVRIALQCLRAQCARLDGGTPRFRYQACPFPLSCSMGTRRAWVSRMVAYIANPDVRCCTRYLATIVQTRRESYHVQVE